MSYTALRIGLIGAGENTRRRHIPGLRALPGVELVAVCNRRLESTLRVAREYGIPRTYEHWEDLVEATDLDAVVIGTWPHLHCPITLAALELGKHVLTEARMAMNAAEAHRMLAASKQRPHLVTQVVPSPFGLRGHEVMKELLRTGYIGEPREMHVFGMTDQLSDPATPLSWRQDATLSGYNMLTLGILHETVLRWVAPVVRVLAQVHAFIPTRIDPASGVRRAVGTPDSVQVLTIHADGMRGVYQFSGVTPFGPGTGVVLYGREGAICYDMNADRILAGRLQRGRLAHQMHEIAIPPERERQWTVEADFVAAIREGTPIELTDFATGVEYMEFTEAVALSAQMGVAVDLPLRLGSVREEVTAPTE
ncbi:MAG: Gfo/Idh/MocA family oxidoreductase [Gemmatales bacterium]|nr:Gfo/Idh/MocA family oxidoreductase [Gemmatales bacterium]MDW8385641.1 Gfo/Idh/MocA family oxidoreductase [Gemmatales bacterium]